MAERIHAGGQLGPQILIGTGIPVADSSLFSTEFQGVGPSVTFQPNGDFFAVAFTAGNSYNYTGTQIAVGGPYNTVSKSYFLPGDFDAAVSTLGTGGFVVAYSSGIKSGLASNPIFGQRGTYN